MSTFTVVFVQVGWVHSSAVDTDNQKFQVDTTYLNVLQTACFTLDHASCSKFISSTHQKKQKGFNLLLFASFCYHFSGLLLSDLFWGGPINAAEKVPRLETPEMPNTGAKVIYLPNLVMTNIAMRNGP
jgi:hypothetical protein